MSSRCDFINAHRYVTAVHIFFCHIHFTGRHADSLSGLSMDNFWLLIAVSGLVASIVFGQSPEEEFGNVPPLPETGMLLVCCEYDTRLLTIPVYLDGFSSHLFQWMRVCGSTKTQIQLHHPSCSRPQQY